MAEIAATTISGRELSVQGNRRVVTGTVVTLATAAAAEDTVFCGLSVVTGVHASWASSVASSVHVLTCWPSTVTAGGFVLRSATTHDNFPVSFRAEGR